MTRVADGEMSYIRTNFFMVDLIWSYKVSDMSSLDSATK